jgi:hypothetical protein
MYIHTRYDVYIYICIYIRVMYIHTRYDVYIYALCIYIHVMYIHTRYDVYIYIHVMYIHTHYDVYIYTLCIYIHVTICTYLLYMYKNLYIHTCMFTCMHVTLHTYSFSLLMNNTCAPQVHAYGMHGCACGFQRHIHTHQCIHIHIHNIEYSHYTSIQHSRIIPVPCPSTANVHSHFHSQIYHQKVPQLLQASTYCYHQDCHCYHWHPPGT